jgi:hypothetical protein
MRPAPPTLEVKFRRDYKDPAEAAQDAVDTARTYMEAGIPGIACYGGPALYRDYEEILMGYGVELVVAIGCETWNYEIVWVRTFNAIMDGDLWKLDLPLHPTAKFKDAKEIVERGLQHERAIDNWNMTTPREHKWASELYEKEGTTPREWIHFAIKNNLRYTDAQYPSREKMEEQGCEAS